MIELGIVDIREIIKSIKTICDCDFSLFALTSFKQRLERFMQLYGIPSGDLLIKKLNDEPGFLDSFLYEISVPSTEMFRDPSLWRWLREDCFPEMLKRNTGKLRIWLPYCVSGGELYSLAILLSEMGWIDKVQITASGMSDKSLENIRQGSYDLKKIEVSEENYRRFNGISTMSTYYKVERNTVIRNTSLVDQVELKKLNINFDHAPQNCKLILFRNCLIYYNPSQQERILNVLYESLSVAGTLILGIREKITTIGSNREFELINATESVYRKRINN
jgi:chemotaxis protein methyltransferase CheR